MARKGNLLFNGGFETGTTEGWINGIFGFPHDLSLSASSDAKYRGNYGGLVKAEDSIGYSVIGYDKLCSFEEYDAYLYLVYCKNVSGQIIYPELFGVDDNGRYIDTFGLGYIELTTDWSLYQSILRGIGEITHFKVGIYAYTNALGDIFYFDEARLIPLRSIKSHQLVDYKLYQELTSDTFRYVHLSCVGLCKLRSLLKVDNVSGTSPTLDVSIYVASLHDSQYYYTLTHSQFTNTGFEEIKLDVSDVSFLYVDYDLGGTSPSFTLRHIIRLEPE